MLIFGFHPVREALRHRPHELQRVLIGDRREGKRREEIENLCRQHRLEVRITPEPELSRLVAGVHNGFAAELRPQAELSPGRKVDPHLVVLLEDIQDPRNLGALLRVCEGAGVGRVLIRDRGTAPISPAVVKTAAGATEWLAIERITNTATEVARLKKEDFWVYGADAQGDPPWEADLTGPVVLCFGGEEKGLRARTRKVCDRLLGLPMRGRIESLNVSAAAAALIYEAVRQRLKPPST
jgi:23S rRNA (guanosine2251-2'-O)-methyltransferase